MKKENFQIISQTDQLLLDVLTAEPEGETPGVGSVSVMACASTKNGIFLLWNIWQNRGMPP